MKVLKIVIGTYILLNSINLYAESTNECMKYWEKPAAKVSVLQDIQCSNIWEDNFSKENKKLVKEIGFNLKDKNWVSTGSCSHVKYNDKDYYIYWADMKHNKTDLIMIYNTSNSFAYSRALDAKKIKEGFKKEDSIDVDLSCGKVGEDINIVSVLNGYLLKETSINNISKYKVYDRFK